MHLPLFIQGQEEKKAFQELIKLKGHLVPFIGAGFSIPICPGWEKFLAEYYKDATDAGFLYAADH